MKPHPRIRRTVKWGGLAASIFLLAVWIASACWVIGYQADDGYSVRLVWGRVGITWIDPEVIPLPRRVSALRTWPPVLQWWVWGGRDVTGWGLDVPIWMIWLPVAAATAGTWRLETLARRKARAGRCAKCGYDRRGLAAGGVCPECGEKPAARAGP